MKKGKIVVTIVLWVTVIAVLSFFMKPVKNTSCVAEAERLLITGRSGYELPIVYEEVARIEYRGELDYGSLLDGVDDGKEKSGRWENGEFGQYLLCVNAKVKPCIVLHTAEHTIVINFESQPSTEALYDALVEQINTILYPQSGTEETPSGEGQMVSSTAGARSTMTISSPWNLSRFRRYRSGA